MKKIVVVVIGVVFVAVGILSAKYFLFGQKKDTYSGVTTSSHDQTLLVIESDIPGYSLSMTNEEYFWTKLNEWGVLTKPKTIFDNHTVYGNPLKGIEVRLTSEKQNFLEGIYGTGTNVKVQHSAGMKIDYDRSFLIVYLHIEPDYLAKISPELRSQIASRSLFARLYGTVYPIDKNQDVLEAEKLDTILKIEKL